MSSSTKPGFRRNDGNDPFSEKLRAWQEYTRTPWARIRYAVVGEILRREASALGEGLQVLDVGGGDGMVGGGDGMDALPLAPLNSN